MDLFCFARNLYPFTPKAYPRNQQAMLLLGMIDFCQVSGGLKQKLYIQRLLNVLH
jgi:hypothetical protein